MRNKYNKKSFFKILFKIIILLCINIIIIIFIILGYFATDLPDLKNITSAVRVASVEVQSYDGKTIATYGDLYEDIVQVKSLPNHVIQAFLSIEDKRFLTHFGIDFIGFSRAIYQNYIKHKVVQGGSTITQQLAKNILIGEGIVTHYDRSIGRKIRELLLAFWLEYKFTKQEIMMMYLNRVYFGAGTYGIEAAAKKHFNKSASQLMTFEAAILAGSLRAPAKYNPSNHKDFAYARAMIVLKKMEEQGYIKSAKDIEKKEAQIALSHTKKQSRDNSMYFCDYAYEQAKKILGEIDDDIIVVTTFDKHKQLVAEEAINYFYKNEKDNYKFSQVSFICMGRHGDIQAMIGGVDYSTSQFNRVVQAKRFPGSAFKLFIYGAAIEHGYQLYDQISDAPITIGNWSPKNYKWKTRGNLSLIDAFTYSVNTVCVRLAKSIGLKRISKFASKLGITNVSENDLSVALGTTPVTLKDITAAYTCFMDGYSIWPYCIIEIRKKDGTIIYSREKEELVYVLDEEVLNNCRDLLHSVVQRGTGRAAKVNDYIYGKTGSNGDTDAWFIGFYDPNDENSGCSLGVWIGNDMISQKMSHNSTGGRIPARIAARFLSNILKEQDINNDQKTIKNLEEFIENLY